MRPAPPAALRQSWRTFLGLASRAFLITSERFLDCVSMAHSFKAHGLSGAPALLLVGLLLTTLLMAVTMQRHWSALKRGRAHGRVVGVVMASLQIAPIWEMLDKALARRPREGDVPPARQPLLRYESAQTRGVSHHLSGMNAPRSDMPKGSPGENAMRGVRKMSMVNLPQAMLSLWVHARQLAPVGEGKQQHLPSTDELLAFAFAAAFFCVAFGIADFVLYIWVHDAFVRENKKLVTLHYCVEILCRVPTVVLFHVSYSRHYRYLPTLILFIVDVLLTSMLLLVSRLSMPDRWWDLFRCSGARTFNYRSLMQFLYSLVVSVMLFVVNIVFFDPGMIFFYVNQAFYVIKYIELAVMLHLIRKSHASSVMIASEDLNKFWWVELTLAAMNAFFVWVYVPSRRAEKDARLTSAVSPHSSGDENVEIASGCSPRPSLNEDGSGRLLERLEEIFEMLRMLSISNCGRNRTRLLGIIVNELWLQALRWDGEYEDRLGNTIHLAVSRPQCAVARVRITPNTSALTPSSAAVAAAAGEQHLVAVLDGPRIAIQWGGSVGMKYGHFDGRQIRWDDGEVWSRRGEVGGAGASQARTILRLILPQLALALKWETHAHPHVADSHHRRPSEAALDAAAAPANGAGHGALAPPPSAATMGLGGRPGVAPLQLVTEVSDYFVPPAHYVSPEAGSGTRPLLHFLCRYAIMSRQADFISDLYWFLVCLSQEEGVPHGHFHHLRGIRGGHLGGYRSARVALLRMLRGEGLEAMNSGSPPSSRHGGLPGAGDDRGAAEERVEVAAFLEEARQLLRGQRELWHQKMELLVAMGHQNAPACCSGGVGRSSGSGAWAHRTDDFRDSLRRWPELRRRLRATCRFVTKNDEDAVLLGGPLGAHGELASPSGGILPVTTASGGSLASLLETHAAPPASSLPSGSPGPMDLVSPDGSAFVSLPIDPTVSYRGIAIDQCEVVPSKHAPLLFTCWTSGGGSRNSGMASESPRSPGGITREKYLLKIGDDLRQDQLILQVMALMGCVWQERLEPSDAKLLQLAKFRVLAITPQSGYVKFVPDAVSLTHALHESKGDLVTWLDRNRPLDLPLEKVLDTFCGSVAASCVVTYILGIGDRHLENLCITRRGQFFHIDFSFVLGDDPKPCAPQVRFPQQVAQALLATDRLDMCFGLAAHAYLSLRPFAGLWGSVLQLTAAAGGAGCAKLAREPMAAVAGVRERLRVDQVDDEIAASEFLCLVRESSEGLASILMDKVHAAGLFWR